MMEIIHDETDVTMMMMMTAKTVMMMKETLMKAMIIPIILIFKIIFTIGFQLMAVTASAYLVAWGPFSVLCIWEMVVQPKVSLNQGHDGDGDD